MKFILNSIGMFLYYVLYVFMWKRIIKRIIRLFTGKHEIERNVMRYNNFAKLGRIALIHHIEKCVLNSLELVPLRETFICGNYNEETINRISDTIRTIKGIRDQQFYNRLKSILRGYNNVVIHKEELRKIYSIKCDVNNEQHLLMLMDLWEELKGDRNITIPDKRWSKHM